MKKLLYILIVIIGGGTIYAASSLLSKSNTIEKAEKLFLQGDTIKALEILEKAGNNGDVASCRYLYHYYDSIYDTPADAYAEVEEVITPDGDWIWYGNPDQKPIGARLPSAEEMAEEVVDSVVCVYDSLPGKDIPIQWYWLRRAAEFGDAESQCEYGELTQFSLGTDTAMVWWEKSALQNYPRGVLFYGNELYNKALEKKSQSIGLKAFQTLTKAYGFGKDLPSAGWHLGLCYMNAVGTHEDIEKGLECLRQSAKYGYPEAIIEMSELGLEESPYWEKKAREEGLK